MDVDVAACPTLSFSEKNLRSVVYNLLSNALKYRHPSRPLRIGLRTRPCGGNDAGVQDNGLGLNLATRTSCLPCSSACTTTWRAPALACTW